MTFIVLICMVEQAPTATFFTVKGDIIDHMLATKFVSGSSCFGFPEHIDALFARDIHLNCDDLALMMKVLAMSLFTNQ